MKLYLRPTANKQLQKLPIAERKKVVRHLTALEENPLLGKHLSGEYAGKRSLRAWPYRIIYTVTARQVIVLSILHRQGAYN